MYAIRSYYGIVYIGKVPFGVDLSNEVVRSFDKISEKLFTLPKGIFSILAFGNVCVDRNPDSHCKYNENILI